MTRPALDTRLLCPAGHMVGERLEPDVVMVKKGRRIVIGPTPTSITCECGRVWKKAP